MDLEIIEYCNNCKEHTNHVKEEENSDINACEGPEYYFELDSKLHQILKCKKCSKQFTRLRYSQFSKTIDLFTQKSISTREYWDEYHPKRLVNTLHKKTFPNVPLFIDKGYSDIIFTYNQNKTFSCASSIKMLLEGILLSLEIHQTSIPKGIRELYDTKIDMNFIDRLKVVEAFARHLNLNQLHNATKAELRLVIELLENLISQLYQLPNKKLDEE